MNSGISIVVCTFNGLHRMKPTLDAIASQIVDPDLCWELLIIDNASTDETNKWCTEYLENTNSKVSWKIIKESKPGLNNARLRGLGEAQYEFILFCDDDNHLFPQYVQKGFELIKNNPAIGALGGCGIPFFEEEKPEWFDRYSHSFAVGPQAAINGKLPGWPAEIYGAGAILRKSALLFFFDKGFNTVMTDRVGKQLVSGGDVEWCLLIQLAGYEIWYESKLCFYHLMPPGRLTWPYYLKLKSGIASGEGLLKAYDPFFAKATPGTSAFLINYFRQGIKTWLTLIHYQFRSFVQPSHYSAEQKDLGKVILQAKLQSYRTNLSVALRHYNQLKSIL